MSRFTLIEVDNFPDSEIDVIALPIYLQEGMYRHQKDIDFASEAEVYEAIAGWPAPRPSITRMIIEYKDIGYRRWQVKGLVAQQYHFEHFVFDIPYRTSLIVSVDRGRRMCSGMLPLTEMMREILEAFGPVHTIQIPMPRVPEIPPTIVSVNSEQNTHTASVHRSATQTIKKLQARYQDTLDEEKSLVELKTMLKKLEPKAFPDLNSLVIAAAKRSIQSLTRIADETEGSSGLSVKYIIALVWTAIDDKETLLVEKEEALKGLLKNLYEIRRDGNIDEHGKDDGRSDKPPICLGGTINKLVDTLNTIHPDAQIIFATKTSASLKFPALVREYAVNFIKNNTEKTTLFEQIKRGKDASGYPIPEFVLEAIKEPVKTAFKEEFATYVTIKDLDDIFSSYEYVSLTENNINRIKAIFCEEQVELLRKYIDNINENLKKSDSKEKSKQQIEVLDKTLNAMLDRFIADIKQGNKIDKDFCSKLKEGFTRQLNESRLFSSSTLEILHHQILMMLNKLIEILSGRKIVSISSRTELFKQKQETQLSLKDNFEYAINHLPAVCNI